nr:CHASE3 domain-containing protein [Candidatus Eremiobacteraeota bacterium]
MVRTRRPVLYTVLALALILPVLIVAGVLIRNQVASSFHTAEQTRAARVLAFNALKYQLDEETGIRGYTATRDPQFLQPYRAGRAQLAGTL